MEIIARRKNPDIEFYDEDLESFNLPDIHLNVICVNKGINNMSNIFPYPSSIQIRKEYIKKDNQIKESLVLGGDVVASKNVDAENFCKELMDVMIRNQGAEVCDANVPIITEVINELSLVAFQSAFKTKSQLVLSKTLPGFGYIKAGADKFIVSTIETIEFRADTLYPYGSSPNFTIAIDGCIISSDINMFGDCIVEFYLCDKCISFPIKKMLSKESKQGLTKYIVSADSCSVDSIKEEMPAPRSSFKDVLDFIADREQYLTKLELKKDDDNMIEDLFSF